MRLFGLIGYPLTHSFSKKYFTEKFGKEGITDSRYELFEIKDASQLTEIISNNQDLCGLNVTIPHKKAVLPFLDELDEPIRKIGAVNVIKVTSDGKLKGYNSDYYGFKYSLLNFLPEGFKSQALVLGTGGAAEAVFAALGELKISYKIVSRDPAKGITYQDIDASLLEKHHLIINTTPLGMYPKIETCPEIPYHLLNSSYFLYDLVYNPEETSFMKRGKDVGAQTKNGLEMLILQAEKAWEIWNS